MPKEVTITVNPGFKPEGAAEKAQFETAKQIGDKTVTYQTAVEAIRNSKGLYQIKDDAPLVVTPSVWHAGKTNQELLAMLVGFGIKTEKQMKKSEIIALIEKKIGEVEVEDDTTAN